MLKDLFGQQIGPGDVAFFVEGMQLCVVTRLWAARDADGFPMESAEVAWSDFFGRVTRPLNPKELLRISDYSDFDVEYRNAIVDLEELYMTITGENYG